jgi:two-component system invasion response regulator UvrY
MIKILVADDHTIVREGLKQILSNTEDLLVGGEATNGNEVLAKVQGEDWDVVLLDMSMPGRSGVDLIKRLKEEKPKLPVLVLSMYKEEQYAVRALKAGASGYVTKLSASEQLVSAIRKVAGGGVFVSAALAEKLALNLMPTTETLPHTELSDRESQVFLMIVAGQSVSGIAEDLKLSVKTVSTHKTRILQKMNMTNTAELIHYAIRHNLVDEPSPF